MLGPVQFLPELFLKELHSRPDCGRGEDLREAIDLDDFGQILFGGVSGARLEIMQRPDTVDTDPSKPNIGFVHVSFAVGSTEGVDSKTAELVNAGYKVTIGPRTTGDGYYESSIIGPEGIQIEITV